MQLNDNCENSGTASLLRDFLQCCWITAINDHSKELQCVLQIKDIGSTCVNKHSVSCIAFHFSSTNHLQQQTSSLWSSFFPTWSASD